MIDDEERRRIAKEAKEEALSEVTLESRLTALESKFSVVLRTVTRIAWAGAAYIGFKIMDFLSGGWPR